MKKVTRGILATLGAFIGFVTGVAIMDTEIQKRLHYKETVLQKKDAIIRLFNQWMIVKQEKRSIADYLKKRGYHMVSIYGMSYLGERLYDELIGTDIVVAYIIDQNDDRICSKVDIFQPDDELPMVDAMIVTAFFYFTDIEFKYSHVDYPIVSIEEIIYLA